mgnify:CR=1 FL=1
MISFLQRNFMFTFDDMQSLDNACIHTFLNACRLQYVRGLINALTMALTLFMAGN